MSNLRGVSRSPINGSYDFYSFVYLPNIHWTLTVCQVLSQMMRTHCCPEHVSVFLGVPVDNKPTRVSECYKHVGRDAPFTLPPPQAHTTLSAPRCFHTGLNAVNINNSAAY